jgi:hypothetical protein
MTFDGYKSYVQNATGTYITILSVDYNPRGGLFIGQSTNPYDTVANTTLIPNSNSTSCMANVTTTASAGPTSKVPFPSQGIDSHAGYYSAGALAGSVVGAAMGGLLLGACAMAIYSRTSRYVSLSKY